MAIARAETEVAAVFHVRAADGLRPSLALGAKALPSFTLAPATHRGHRWRTEAPPPFFTLAPPTPCGHRWR